MDQPLLPTVAEHDVETPELFGQEARQWTPYDNLDIFFVRLYNYWRGKGFVVIVVSRALNLLALAFTVAFSGFLLLFVDWGALKNAECLVEDACDIADVAIYSNPFEHGTRLGNAFKVTSLAVFSGYWLWSAIMLVLDLRRLRDVWSFCKNKLGVSERALQTMMWPELVYRVVLLQSTTRLSVRRDLTEHDIVCRIMRKENYLIGMLNKGVLGLHVPLGRFSRAPLLTTSVVWNLSWCLLDPMFDERFRIRAEFLRDGTVIAQRFRVMAVVNAVLTPFLLVFMTMHYFLSNMERFYHHPKHIGARRWSLLAQWKMRELSELPHFVEHRLNSANEAANLYCSQFPAPLTGAIANFATFVAASLAGVLIVVALVNDMLVERHLYGHTVVWWGAAVGVVLAGSRAFLGDDHAAYDPEAAMMEVVRETHWVPRHWRGRAHRREVQAEFQALFQYQVVLFLEEVASVLLMPYLLWVTLPQSAETVSKFLREFTSNEDGVGHVCSLATFDLQRHGNARYGAPSTAQKPMRTRQGKLEKSLVTFATAYPTWQPTDAASHFLGRLDDAHARATCDHPAPRDSRPPGVGDASLMSVSGDALSGRWDVYTPAQGVHTQAGAHNRSGLRHAGAGALDGGSSDGARASASGHWAADAAEQMRACEQGLPGAHATPSDRRLHSHGDSGGPSQAAGSSVNARERAGAAAQPGPSTQDPFAAQAWHQVDAGPARTPDGAAFDGGLHAMLRASGDAAGDARRPPGSQSDRTDARSDSRPLECHPALARDLSHSRRSASLPMQVELQRTASREHAAAREHRATGDAAAHPSSHLPTHSRPAPSSGGTAAKDPAGGTRVTPAESLSAAAEAAGPSTPGRVRVSDAERPAGPSAAGSHQSAESEIARLLAADPEHSPLHHSPLADSPLHQSTPSAPGTMRIPLPTGHAGDPSSSPAHPYSPASPADKVARSPPAHASAPAAAYACIEAAATGALSRMDSSGSTSGARSRSDSRLGFSAEPFRTPTAAAAAQQPHHGDQATEDVGASCSRRDGGASDTFHSDVTWGTDAQGSGARAASSSAWSRPSNNPAAPGAVQGDNAARPGSRDRGRHSSRDQEQPGARDVRCVWLPDARGAALRDLNVPSESPLTHQSMHASAPRGPAPVFHLWGSTSAHAGSHLHLPQRAPAHAVRVDPQHAASPSHAHDPDAHASSALAESVYHDPLSDSRRTSASDSDYQSPSLSTAAPSPHSSVHAQTLGLRTRARTASSPGPAHKVWGAASVALPPRHSQQQQHAQQQLGQQGQAVGLRAPLERGGALALSMAHQTGGVFGGAEARAKNMHTMLQHEYEAAQPDHIQLRLAASSCSWLASSHNHLHRT